MPDKTVAGAAQVFQRAFNDGPRDTLKLTIDYETFVRIVSAQAAIRAFRVIQSPQS